MKTANDIMKYIMNEWYGYMISIYDRYGVTVTVSELTITERTVIEMYRIAANCFT